MRTLATHLSGTRNWREASCAWTETMQGYTRHSDDLQVRYSELHHHDRNLHGSSSAAFASSLLLPITRQSLAVLQLQICSVRDIDEKQTAQRCDNLCSAWEYTPRLSLRDARRSFAIHPLAFSSSTTGR